MIFMTVLTITKQNFETEVIHSEKTVLLDFWAEWCGPCRMVSPIVDEIAEETDNLKVGKINVDDEAELAQKFGIMSIPTLILMKNGAEVKRLVGARSKSELLSWID